MSIKEAITIGVKVAKQEYILFFILFITKLIIRLDFIFGKSGLGLLSSWVFLSLIASFSAGGFVTLVKEILEDKKYNLNNFFINCKKYFLKIFTVQVIFLFLIGIVFLLAIFLKKYSKSFIALNPNIFIVLVILVFIVVFSILFLCSVLITWIEIPIVIEDITVLKALKNFFIFFRKNIKTVILIILLNIIFIGGLELLLSGEVIKNPFLSVVVLIVAFILISYFGVILCIAQTALYINYLKENRAII